MNCSNAIGTFKANRRPRILPQSRSRATASIAFNPFAEPGHRIAMPFELTLGEEGDVKVADALESLGA